MAASVVKWIKPENCHLLLSWLAFTFRTGLVGLVTVLGIVFICGMILQC